MFLKIGSGNNGKDGGLLRTFKEKLALYIGSNYGDDACQEWLLENQLVLQEPTYLDAVQQDTPYVPEQ
jgi:hypothetical protein